MTAHKQSLVIGNTSQLAQYFPPEYVKVSSRTADFKGLSHCEWKTVYICFAEQRTYLANSIDEEIRSLFWETNYSKVLELIRLFQPVCEKIVYYSTAELWNKCNGPVSEDTDFSYHHNHYTDSKHRVSMELKNKDRYPKVVIAYPFNFNSVYRGEGYLFSKVFKSIIERVPVIAGDVDYYREMLHPKMVVDMTLDMPQSRVIGSGRVIHIGDFIKQLYSRFGLDSREFFTSEVKDYSIYRKYIFYADSYKSECNQNELLNLLSDEIDHAYRMKTIT